MKLKKKTKPKVLNRTRVQADLPEKAMARLAKLKDATEAVSYAEVIKNALVVYEAAIDAQEKQR